MNKGTMTTRTSATVTAAVAVTESLVPVFIGNRTALNESIHHDDVFVDRYCTYQNNKYCYRNNNNSLLDPCSDYDSDSNDNDDDLSMIVEHSSSISTIGFDSNNNSNESNNKVSVVSTNGRKNDNHYNNNNSNTDKKLLTQSGWLHKKTNTSLYDCDEKDDTSDEFLLLFPNDHQSNTIQQSIEEGECNSSSIHNNKNNDIYNNEQQNHLQRRPRMQRFLSCRSMKDNTCSSLSFKVDSPSVVKTTSSSKISPTLLLSGSLHNKRDSTYSALLDHKYSQRQQQQQKLATVGEKTPVNKTYSICTNHINVDNPVRTKTTHHDEQDYNNNSVLQQIKMIPETQQERLIMLKHKKASAQRLVAGCLSGFKNSIHNEQNNNNKNNTYMSKTIHASCSLTIHEKYKLKQIEKKKYQIPSPISIKETDHDDSDDSSISDDNDSWASDNAYDKNYSGLDSNKQNKEQIQNKNVTGNTTTASLIHQQLQPKTKSASTTRSTTTIIKSLPAKGECIVNIVDYNNNYCSHSKNNTTKKTSSSQLYDVYQSYKNIIMELDGNDDEEASVGW